MEVMDRIEVEVELKAKSDKLQKDFDRQIADLKRKYSEIFTNNPMKQSAAGRSASGSIYEAGWQNKAYKKGIAEYEAGVKKVADMEAKVQKMAQQITDREIASERQKIEYQKEGIRIEKERQRLALEEQNYNPEANARQIQALERQIEARNKVLSNLRKQNRNAISEGKNTEDIEKREQLTKKIEENLKKIREYEREVESLRKGISAIGNLDINKQKKISADKAKLQKDEEAQQNRQVQMSRFSEKTEQLRKERSSLEATATEEGQKLNDQLEELYRKMAEVEAQIKGTSDAMDNLDEETKKLGESTKKKTESEKAAAKNAKFSKNMIAKFFDMFKRILAYKLINSIINGIVKLIKLPFTLIKKFFDKVKEGMQKIYDQDKATGKDTPYTIAKDRLTVAMEKLSYALGSIGVNFVQAVEPLISRFISEFSELLNKVGESIAKQFDIPQYFKINENIEDVIKEDLAKDVNDIERKLINIDELQIFDSNKTKSNGEDGLGRYGKWVDVDPKALTISETVQKWIDTKLNELVDFFDDFWFGPWAEDPNGNAYRDQEQGFGNKIANIITDILDAIKKLADSFVEKLWPKLKLAFLQLKSIILDDEENELLPYLGESEKDFSNRIIEKYKEQLAEGERNRKLFITGTTGQVMASSAKLKGLINDVNTMLEAEKTFFGKELKLNVEVEVSNESTTNTNKQSNALPHQQILGNAVKEPVDDRTFAEKVKDLLNKLTFGAFFNANGGVYTAPAIGVVGEYANAHSNPEIVTPQSLMRETMEQSNQNVISTLIQCNRQLIAAIENNQTTISIGDDVIAKSANRGNATLQKLYGSNGV